MPVRSELYSSLLDGFRPQMGECGYQKAGSVFRRVAGQNAGLVEFQQSSKSSAQEVIFTINCGVVLGALSLEDEFQPKKATIPDAHVRNRVGFLMSEKRDIWWSLANDTDLVRLGAELLPILDESVIPYVDRYLDPANVIALWSSGVSPGLTEKQRSRYLAQIAEQKAGD